MVGLVEGTVLQFSPELTLGNILTSVTIAVSFIVIYMKFVGRMAVIESRVNDLWEWFLGSHRKGSNPGMGESPRDEPEERH